jgi:anti-sigma regulatory factor (Ser/Thr protein kinase)
VPRSSTERVVVVPAVAASIARTRHWAVDHGRRAGATPGALSSVELATSEVVTNAIRHADGTSTVTVTARVTRRDLTLEVHDADPAPPQVRTGRAGLPGGHGLRLVEAVSSDWGWRAAPDGGKVVWFTIAW